MISRFRWAEDFPEMRAVLFLDLDDTIFQTRSKCPPGQPVRPAAYRRDGTPLSFMTDQQRAMLEMFRRIATIIPTTARNLEAFGRVDVPFDDAVILDFGGVVLAPGRQLDATWDAVIRPQAQATARDFERLLRATEEFVARRHLDATVRLIEDFDMPLYLVVKHREGQGEALAPIRDEWLRHIDDGQFFIHFNDNNLSLIPAFLGKERAVRHVLARYFADEPVVTFGLGDSLSDAAFLEICDFSLTPHGSQLARQRHSTTGGRRCSAAATIPTT